MPKNRDYTGLVRTPSSMAWLIRERARLKGAIDRIDRQLEELPRQRVDMAQALESLDAVFPLHEVKVEPKQVRGTRRKSPPLTGYGAMTKAILQSLREADGQPLFTSEIALRVDNCPVILEYKRSVGENVINQGLFYIDWLMDHKAEFELLVLKRFGQKVADVIDWAAPRLICIASDFTKYDGHAVQQMSHNIELIRYKQFGSELLLLELVKASSASSTAAKSNGVKKVPSIALPAVAQSVKNGGGDKTVAQWFAAMSSEHKALYDSLEGFLLSLGDDVMRKDLKLYIAFKRIRNFACVGFKKDALFLWLKVDPSTVQLEEGFSRDVRQIGHWGTGDLELLVRNHDDLEKAKNLLLKAYAG